MVCVRFPPGALVHASALARAFVMEWLTLFASYAVAVGAVLAYLAWAP
jgi:hypothetical protein